MAQENFKRPIPGMSLTQTPKNAPWERPPQVSDPEDAIKIHLERMSDPDRMEQALFILESGRTTLKGLVSALMRGATYQGIHSVDVGLLVAPVVHEYIKQTADAIGIEYEEGLVDKTAKEKERSVRVAMRARKMLEESGYEPPKVTKESVAEEGAVMKEKMEEVAPEAQEMPEQPMEQQPQAAPRGLMARGA